ATTLVLCEHPNSTVYDATKRLTQVQVHCLSLLNPDIEMGHVVIVPALTGYRPLEFL
ncbi:hypothetical protein EDD15DRAFT_2139303, partial [Pisolithus albus]